MARSRRCQDGHLNERPAVHLEATCMEYIMCASPALGDALKVVPLVLQFRELLNWLATEEPSVLSRRCNADGTGDGPTDHQCHRLTYPRVERCKDEPRTHDLAMGIGRLQEFPGRNGRVIGWAAVFIHPGPALHIDLSEFFLAIFESTLIAWLFEALF